MLDVGQANELKLAFRRADWSNDDIKRLCEGDVLADVRRVLRRQALIAAIEHIIDCDKDPYLPDGWKVEDHLKGDKLIWDASKVNLYLSDHQKNYKTIRGRQLLAELAGKPVLNANVLDYLLANKYIIPEEWKGKYVFFWGTVYSPLSGTLCVRYLFWSDRERSWAWNQRWLGTTCRDDEPAALLVS